MSNVCCEISVFECNVCCKSWDDYECERKLLMVFFHIGYSKSIEKKTNIFFNNIINILLNYR